MLQEEPFCNHHKKKKRNINCYVLVSPDEFELTFFFFSVFLALLQKCILWGEDGFYKLQASFAKSIAYEVLDDRHWNADSMRLGVLSRLRAKSGNAFTLDLQSVRCSAVLSEPFYQVRRVRHYSQFCNFLFLFFISLVRKYTINLCWACPEEFRNNLTQSCKFE